MLWVDLVAMNGEVIVVVSVLVMMEMATAMAMVKEEVYK